MRSERGDTLVEVLIATAILAAAIVGGLGIMNFGFGIVLNAIERTQVQAEVTSQISLARYARDAYVRVGKSGAGGGGAAVWEKIITNANTSYNANICSGTAGDNPFFITDDGATYTLSSTARATTSQPTAGQGLWVEAVRPASTNYVDIYVKSCWQPAAGSTDQEAKSVVRLYVP